jgi:hypothetical protein
VLAKISSFSLLKAILISAFFFSFSSLKVDKNIALFNSANFSKATFSASNLSLASASAFFFVSSPYLFAVAKPFSAACLAASSLAF